MIDMGVQGYADFEAGNGARIVRHGATHWRMVGPFFWRPLLPFLENARPSEVPRRFYLGGFQHPVGGDDRPNSLMHYYAFPRPGDYGPDTLPRKSRQAVAHARKHLRVEESRDRDSFVEASHPVYLSFYSRTRYRFLESRVRKDRYAAWCDNLFRGGRLTILVARAGKSMAGFMALGRVGKVAIIVSTFSDTGYLKMGPSDLLYDEARRRIAACPGIERVYLGGVVSEDGINRFKEKRGATLVSVPSRYYLNPALRYPVRCLFRDEYHKILGDRFPGGTSALPVP